MTTVFVDTSILCNLLPVPGKCQDHAEVKTEYDERRGAGATFVLPISTVIETGNHIEQLPDGLGADRRRCAEGLTAILRLIAAGQAPWVLHELAWDGELLLRLCDGGKRSPAFVDVATRGHLGGGDVAILVERDRYLERVSGATAEIWTKDRTLASYAG